MIVPRDKLLHIALGLLWLANTMVNLWVFKAFGLGPAAAYGTTAFGILYEINQWIRKEGQPDPWDALATASPGWAVWAVLELLA